MKLMFVCLVASLVTGHLGSFAEKQHGYKKPSPKRSFLLPKKTGNTKLSNAVQLTTINEIGDLAVNEIPSIMRKFNLDPFLAPDQKQSISPVNLELSDIKVFNLTNIKRVSDILVYYAETAGKMTAGLTLQFNTVKLLADYNAYIKVPFLPAMSSKGLLTANVAAIDVKLTVLIDFKQFNATLDNLTLSIDRRDLNVILSGSLEGQMANIAMPVIVTILQGIILNIIEGPLRAQINDILNKIVLNIQENLVQMG